MYSTFWERFSAECDRIGKKPNQIKDEIGVSSGTLSNWKKGVIPDGKTLIRIAMLLKVTTDYLLGISWVEEEEDKEKADLPQSALDPQIEALIKIFRECDAEGQFNIIVTAKQEHARSQKEKNAQP